MFTWSRLTPMRTSGRLPGAHEAQRCQSKPELGDQAHALKSILYSELLQKMDHGADF
jgi:hypothetical protein